MKRPKGPFFCQDPNCTCWFKLQSDRDTHYRMEHGEPRFTKKQKKRLGIGWREIIEHQRSV